MNIVGFLIKGSEFTICHTQVLNQRRTWVQALGNNSTKLELKFWEDLTPARGVSKIWDGENIWQWSRLINAFCWSTIPQKQSGVIIIIITNIPVKVQERKNLWKNTKVCHCLVWLNFILDANELPGSYISCCTHFDTINCYIRE